MKFIHIFSLLNGKNIKNFQKNNNDNEYANNKNNNYDKEFPKLEQNPRTIIKKS